MKPGSLRETMPIAATIIDDLRAAFGAEGINAQIRKGMNGLPMFFACENGNTIGVRAEVSGTVISVVQMNLFDRGVKRDDQI